MKILLIQLLLFTSYTCYSQVHRVYGTVVDKQTGEKLISAHVYDSTYMKGVISNSYGFYSIELTKGKHDIYCSMLGYRPLKNTVTLGNDTVINIVLEKSDYLLDDVIVYGEQNKHVGSISLTPDQIKKIPTIGGEPDLFKGLQFLPGVVSGNDGVNNLSVRGGSHWQNLVLLDEAVVYNPNHALSFLSVFNNDAVKQVSFYKSYAPLNYGGRLSSVMDVRMNEGNDKELGIKGGVGLLSSRLTVEGPILEDKVSFMVSGRYGYPAVIANGVGKMDFLGGNIGQLEKADINFYDINAKINAKVSKRDQLFVSFYTSKDYFMTSALIDDYAMKWGNTTATLRWNRVLNEKINTNTLAYFSNYHYRYDQFADGQNYLWKSDMQSYTLRHNLDIFLLNNLRYKVGGGIEYFVTRPGSIDKIEETSNIIPYSLEQRKSMEAVVYSELQYDLGNRWQLNGGIRLTGHYSFATKKYPGKLHWLPEPRFEAIYKLKEMSTLSFSGTYLWQSMHLLSNSSVGIPSDIWLPSNDRLKPSSALQFSTAYKHNLFNGLYTFMAEAYYKNSWNILDYRDNADIFMNNEIETQLEKGRADSYGLELSFSKNRGRTTGRLNYTLSKTTNHIPGINDGKSYSPVYDRPHNLKLVVAHQFSDKWSVSSTFALRSGMNVTMPVGTYIYQGVTYYYYSERNGYRAPLFHQLDLSLSYKPATRKRWKSEWVFGLQNVYNRKNVFSMYAGRDKRLLNEQKIYKMYLYGILPSVSYNFKF